LQCSEEKSIEIKKFYQKYIDCHYFGPWVRSGYLLRIAQRTKSANSDVV